MSSSVLLSPLTIRKTTLRNRIMLPSMVTHYCAVNGEVSERLIAYHAERAYGGVGLNVLESTSVDDTGKSYWPGVSIASDHFIKGLRRLTDAIHAHGGKVVSNINCPLAWEVGNVEKVSDALTVGFDTYPSATLDVMFGRFAPVGKLPLTLPKGDEVLAVNADGVCISPNDVPGFAKDAYMPDSMKDENGKAYAYRDAAGNYYEMNFGLTF